VKKWFWILAAYVVLGFIVDYTLYGKNSPTGVAYQPRLNVIFGWPYYGVNYF
jgi:hypothetical protein